MFQAAYFITALLQTCLTCLALFVLFCALYSEQTTLEVIPQPLAGRYTLEGHCQSKFL